MESIPSFAEFDALAASQRKEVLINLRQHFNDDDIRELWEMTHKEWYRNLTMLSLPVKGRESTPQEEAEPESDPETAADEMKICSFPGCGKKHAAKGLCLQHYNAERNKKSRRRKKPETASAHNFEDEAASIMKEAIEAAVFSPMVKQEAVDLPFPALKGSPAQLRKQFEAVMMFMEAREDDTTNFEIRLSVTIQAAEVMVF